MQGRTCSLEQLKMGQPKGLTTQNCSQLPTTKVSAQTLAEVRPAPPPPPPPPPTKEPVEDAPGTGELSARAPDHLGAKKPAQPRQEQQPTVELTVRTLPVLSLVVRSVPARSPGLQYGSAVW